MLSLSACTRWFFYPNQQLYSLPSDHGFLFEDVWLEAGDGTQLHAWHVYPESDVRGVVYYLHGNAQNISAHINSVLWLVDAGYRILGLDYRGYGKSAGTPDLPEVFDDIHAGTQWIESSVSQAGEPLPAYLLGQSLGASLAIKYLDEYPQKKAVFSALIVEAGFTRYGSIARHVASANWFTWPFQYPAQWLLTSRYDPLDVMPTLSPLPVMVLHSQDDGIIPFENGKSLYGAASEPKKFIAASGPHIAAFADADVRMSVLDFLQLHQRQR